LLTLIYIISFVDRQIIAVLGVQIRDTLSLSNLQLGLLYGPAFSFVYAFSGIPMGRLADRISRKGMICTGLFVWSAMTVVSGFANTFLILIIARLFVGVSQSMLSPAVYSYLADAFAPEKRATVFSVYASGIFIGIGLSFLVGGSVSLQYDWSTALIVVGLPGLLLAPIVWIILKEPARRDKRVYSESSLLSDIREIVGKKAVQWHLIGFSSLACLGYTILGFVGNVFSDVFSSPEYIPQFGWFMFGVGATVVLSGKISDILARRNEARRFWMPILAAVGGIPFYAVGLFAENALTAFLFTGFGVLISSSYNGVAAALLQYFVTSRQRALAGGMYLFVISIAGFGVGPPLTGWLTDTIFEGRYAVSYAIFSVIIVCGIISVFSFIQAIRNYDADAVQAIQQIND
jgi:MFS family permease